jgi:hypothetical protein
MAVDIFKTVFKIMKLSIHDHKDSLSGIKRVSPSFDIAQRKDA